MAQSVTGLPRCGYHQHVSRSGQQVVPTSLCQKGFQGHNRTDGRSSREPVAVPPMTKRLYWRGNVSLRLGLVQILIDGVAADPVIAARGRFRNPAAGAPEPFGGPFRRCQGLSPSLIRRRIAWPGPCCSGRVCSPARTQSHCRAPVASNPPLLRLTSGLLSKEGQDKVSPLVRFGCTPATPTTRPATSPRTRTASVRPSPTVAPSGEVG
jgi:hypothetical protein